MTRCSKMKKQIEIDSDNVIDIAFSMIVAAFAKINAMVSKQNSLDGKTLDALTNLYIAIATQALDVSDITFERSTETLNELMKLLY